MDAGEKEGPRSAAGSPSPAERNALSPAELERLRQAAPTLLLQSQGRVATDLVAEDALLGEALVLAGVLSREALERAAEVQKAVRNCGVPLGLAEVLARRGVVGWSTLDAVLSALGITTLECSSCRRSYAVRSWSPQQHAECPVCGSSLAPSRPMETMAVEVLATDLLEGDVSPDALAFGRYRVIEELGQGGMGKVSRAWDTLRKRMVALKRVREDLADAPELIARFLREARLTAQLRHPHIISVLDFGEHEGRYYYTCDYLPGLSLDAIMRNPVPQERGVRWAYQVADALAYAHEQGVVHRDIKPANILVDQRGWAYVMDFGLAKGIGGVRADDSATLTIGEQLLGSPPYMSPEQAAKQGKEAGPASDQFSLGVVLYELLTGARPFQANSLDALLAAIQQQDPIRPSRRSAEVGLDLEAVCLKALEKNPSERYPTMREFAEDLGRFLLKKPVSVSPSAFLDRLKAAPRSHPSGGRDVVVELRDVHTRLGRLPVFMGLSLQIVRGETLVVIGRAGIGKTLLLRHINGEVRPDRGQIFVDGVDISGLGRTELALFRQHAGLVFARDTLEPLDTVACSLEAVLKEEGTWNTADGARVIREHLALVDLHFMESRLVSTLSPTMRKRVAIAAALLRRPRIVLYDEPSAGLDPITTGQLNEVILGMKARFPNLTSIVVTHDMPSAFTIADRIAMLDEGRIVKIGRSNDFLVTEDEQVRKFVLGPYKELSVEAMFGMPYDIDLGEVAAAEKTQPHPFLSHYVCGYACHKKSDLDGAIAHYTGALKERPRHVEALANRGAARAAKKDLAGAIEDWAEALKLAPSGWSLRKDVEKRLQAARDKTGKTLHGEPLHTDLDDWRSPRYRAEQKKRPKP